MPGYVSLCSRQSALKNYVTDESLPALRQRADKFTEVYSQELEQEQQRAAHEDWLQQAGARAQGRVSELRSVSSAPHPQRPIVQDDGLVDTLQTVRSAGSQSSQPRSASLLSRARAWLRQDETITAALGAAQNTSMDPEASPEQQVASLSQRSQRR